MSPVAVGIIVPPLFIKSPILRTVRMRGNIPSYEKGGRDLRFQQMCGMPGYLCKLTAQRAHSLIAVAFFGLWSGLPRLGSRQIVGDFSPPLDK